MKNFNNKGYVVIDQYGKVWWESACDKRKDSMVVFLMIPQPSHWKATWRQMYNKGCRCKQVTVIEKNF